MDKERESLFKDAKIDYTNAQTNAHCDHPFKSTMRWLVEEKGNACELVYVVDVDRSNESMVIVIKSDQSYHRVNISRVKSTQEIVLQQNRNDQSKLHQALFFAKEQSIDNAIVPGSLLVEEYDETYTTSGCLCFCRKSHTKRALKGFKVKRYEWAQSNLKGFQTELMNDDVHELQLKTMSDIKDISKVINENNPLQKRLRAKQSTIDDLDEIIDERDQTVKELKDQLQELPKMYDEIKEDLKRVTKQRNVLQDQLVEYSADLATLDSDFPTIQDIVTKFAQTRGQSRLNCANVITKYFKSRNKDSHKLQINKKANDALFDVLTTCYAKLKDYHASVVTEYKQEIKISNERTFKEACYRKLRSEFHTLYDKIEREYMENVLEDIESKYDGVLEYCSTDLWTEYVKECLFICWYIVVSQSPRLQLYPLNCDHVKSRVNKDDDDDEKSNAFEDRKYELAYGSEEEEALNYYIWPTIIRKDNNEQLSKIHALFLNDIPMYSKKGLKRRKA
eukprot:663554_1